MTARMPRHDRSEQRQREDAPWVKACLWLMAIAFCGVLAVWMR